MLPEEYYAKARRLLRIAASRIHQEKLRTVKESTTNDEPTTISKPTTVTSSRKRGNLRKSSDPRKANPVEQTGTNG